eukprot:13749-Heterococcus_DN1.PRE.2
MPRGCKQLTVLWFSSLEYNACSATCFKSTADRMHATTMITIIAQKNNIFTVYVGSMLSVLQKQQTQGINAAAVTLRAMENHCFFCYM